MCDYDYPSAGEENLKNMGIIYYGGDMRTCLRALAAE